MSYCDGFVCPIPRANLDTYKALAELAGSVWREHGALEYREWVADDVPDGVLTSFGKSVLLEEGEVVVIAWILYPSREARDAVNAKVMADPRMICDPNNMPFDAKRMIWGGFTPLVTR